MEPDIETAGAVPVAAPPPPPDDTLSSSDSPIDKSAPPPSDKPGFLARLRGKFAKKPDADKPVKPPAVSLLKLFKYTTFGERLQMALAAVAAIIHGGLLPAFTIIFGRIINSFFTPDGGIITDGVVEKVGKESYLFLVFGGIAFFTSALQVFLQLKVAQRVGVRLRQMYFRSLMTQDFTWYDKSDGGELTARAANDVNLIQAGIGDKVTSAIQFLATFFIGIIIAFVYGPLLTLVVLAVAPLLIAGGAIFGKLAAENTGDGLGAYGAAGAIAHEVIALIRVVTAYNGQRSEIQRYEAELQNAYKSNVKKAIVSGIGLGFTMFIIFCSYGIAFSFGASQVREGKMSNGAILTTFFSVIIACVSIGQAAPAFSAITVAQGAAPRVYEIIERDSEINPLDEEDGETIPDIQGRVTFTNVDFSYRKAEDGADPVQVLSNFSVEVPPGSSYALVGASGCGKSTTVRLIERFYDVQNGVVAIDGRDVRSLNVRWLRSQMGYVGQMPTLFQMSIRDNIALGAALDPVKDPVTGQTVLQRREVTDDEIIAAAQKANAHEFISKMPEGYQTILGERGALLSGGQKQRVCIARALIRDPKILILDESTAALDAKSERVVQDALEQAAAGRTTITIAHRLSTVKHADLISVIDAGHIVEAGTHSSLMDIPDGAYRTLVEHQNIEAKKNEEALNSVGETETGGEGAKVFHDSVTKTKTERQEKDEEQEEVEDPIDKGVLARAFMMNAKEWPFIVLGVAGAAVAGATFPIMAILFADVLNAIGRNEDAGIVRRYSLYYVAIGGAAFFGNLLQLGALGISGERLTRKLRSQAFKAILRQDIGFFDHREHSLGALTTRLAMESSLVQGVTGGTLGGLSFAVSTILCGFLVSYLSCWRVALVVTTVFPVMAVAGAWQMKLMTGFDADSNQRYIEAGAIASEAVDNFDTVTSVGVQDAFITRYNAELQAPLANGARSGLVGGVAFGVSEFLSQVLWAVSFWLGSIFVQNENCTFPDLMKAVTGLLFAGMMLGQVSTYMPDLGKSRIAATKVFRLLDRESAIDPSVDHEGEKPAIGGDVDMQNVTFEYATRTEVPVLRGLSVAIENGKMLALVGASGCGKSTVVALLERFYDPRSGTISVDGHDLPSMNVSWVRDHMGYVSQEPDLFNRSVRDNIAYGMSHVDGSVVTDDMIEQAARQANAHEFITELPEGYDTVVGPRGSKLSGGQRQRVAIARAIVSRPKLLLLDEATSALDAVSERVVQVALDKAREGRTTVAIAHRLSTVKDADAIAVVARGRVVEIGTHDELMAVEGGEYAMLVENQLAVAEENGPA